MSTVGYQIAKKIAILTAGFFVLAVIAGIVYFDRAMNGFFGADTTVHRSDANSFYENHVKELLKLPPGTQIRQITHTQDWVDEFFEIVIPNRGEVPPEKWVKNVWADNRFAPGAKVTPLEYQAYHDPKADPSRIRWFKSSLHHGHRRIWYDVGSNVFILEVGTD